MKIRQFDQMDASAYNGIALDRHARIAEMQISLEQYHDFLHAVEGVTGKTGLIGSDADELDVYDLYGGTVTALYGNSSEWVHDKPHGSIDFMGMWFEFKPEVTMVEMCEMLEKAVEDGNYRILFEKSYDFVM